MTEPTVTAYEPWESASFKGAQIDVANMPYGVVFDNTGDFIVCVVAPKMGGNSSVLVVFHRGRVPSQETVCDTLLAICRGECK